MLLFVFAQLYLFVQLLGLFKSVSVSLPTTRNEFVVYWH